MTPRAGDRLLGLHIRPDDGCMAPQGWRVRPVFLRARFPRFGKGLRQFYGWTVYEADKNRAIRRALRELVRLEVPLDGTPVGETRRFIKAGPDLLDLATEVALRDDDRVVWP